ncbi:hypothetical protein AGMMS50229_17590 [Campylobacterota bacterium]|nr:hypothetical protein AGMMS50229_17590 [Campylobacterota bacterium]
MLKSLSKTTQVLLRLALVIAVIVAIVVSVIMLLPEDEREYILTVGDGEQIINFPDGKYNSIYENFETQKDYPKMRLLGYLSGDRKTVTLIPLGDGRHNMSQIGISSGNNEVVGTFKALEKESIERRNTAFSESYIPSQPSRNVNDAQMQCAIIGKDNVDLTLQIKCASSRITVNSTAKLFLNAKNDSTLGQSEDDGLRIYWEANYKQIGEKYDYFTWWGGQKDELAPTFSIFGYFMLPVDIARQQFVLPHSNALLFTTVQLKQGRTIPDTWYGSQFNPIYLRICVALSVIGAVFLVFLLFMRRNGALG